MYNMNMESMILEDLEKKYPNSKSQMEQLTKLIDSFVTLLKTECKITVGDILCLTKMLYEGGDKKIILTIRKQILDLEDKYFGKTKAVQNLKYLSTCLTNFKPAIFKTIREYFSPIYNVDPNMVKCLPKIKGQQIGTTVEVHKESDDTNPITFYVKTHQEFCSKSHSQFISVSSDKSGTVDFKELFMYKVLEYIGYGPKTHFIVPQDIITKEIEEGILIATQDLKHTKNPKKKTKAFVVFEKIQEKLNKTSLKDITENTKKDIIAIDMLSRSFLLEDVMINTGNFGRITSSKNDNTTTKWKVLDFMPPKLVQNRGDDYSYEKHYPGGKNIFYSFKIGNISHTYNSEKLIVINNILSEENAKNLWLQVANNLKQGTSRKKCMPINEALNMAFDNIASFMKKNMKTLNIKDERLKRRMEDLLLYKNKIQQNFNALYKGIFSYSKNDEKDFKKQKNGKNFKSKTSRLFSGKTQKRSDDTDSNSKLRSNIIFNSKIQ